MANNLTRRSVVAAAPAAVVAATLPALAAGAHPDAGLLALRKPYEQTFALIEAVSPAHSRAEDALCAALRKQPHRDRADVEKEVGFDFAEARYNAAVDANSVVIEQITETPALEGLIFKARVADIDSCNLDLAASIVADLVAMGRPNA